METTLDVETALKNAKALMDMYQDTMNVRSGMLLTMYQRAFALYKEMHPQSQEHEAQEFAEYAMNMLALSERKVACSGSS